MKHLIYADNAATTKLDIDAFEAMKPYLLDEYGNASQPYSFARKPKQALKEAREIIAQCINAEPDEIYFTSGGTESDNWAIKGIAFSSQKRREIITSAFEHHAILKTCKFIETMGYPVTYLSPNSSGNIITDTLDSKITSKTLLVSIMMSNNEIGTIQPIKQLAEIAHRSGAFFHTDAVQCVGHVAIDVKNLGIDLLSASAHKFNGPKGIGFLYIKKGTKIEPLLNGGAQEQGHRAGTENIAAIVGMAVALKKNCEKIYERSDYILKLEKVLLEELKASKVKFIKNGGNNKLPGCISLSFPGFEGEAIMHRLDLAGIQISTGSACDSIKTQISHVLKAINLSSDAAKGTIRISLGVDNTFEDVKIIAETLLKIICGI